MADMQGKRAISRKGPAQGPEMFRLRDEDTPIEQGGCEASDSFVDKTETLDVVSPIEVFGPKPCQSIGSARSSGQEQRGWAYQCPVASWEPGGESSNCPIRPRLPKLVFPRGVTGVGPSCSNILIRTSLGSRSKGTVM